MSDRIAIMDHGRLVQLGPPREVYENPDSAFVARFLGEANLLAVRGAGGQVATVGGGLPVAAEAGRLDAAGQGFLFVRPEKVALRDPSPAEGPNRLAGRVRHASFLGNTVRYLLDLPGEAEPLTADAANGPEARLWPPGAEVVACWRPADARLLAG